MTKMTAIALAAVLATTVASEAATYIYVGSWQVDAGPEWSSVPTPPAYTGQEAAALIFGGSAANYAISTLSDSVNFLAWVSTWGGACEGAFPCGTEVAQDFKVSSEGLYAAIGDTSAYVYDWALGAQYTNYAFRVSEVPLPAGLPLLAAGLGVLGLVARRKRS